MAVAAVRALRPAHWAKNALVLVPLFEGHHTGQTLAVRRALVTFVCFCLCASSGYVLNDLVDAERDRRHPVKALRPIAAGDLAPAAALAIAGASAALGFLVASRLPLRVASVLAAYWLGTLSYSLVLRHRGVFDVLALAGLFTLRLLAGAFCADAPLSPWLFAISMLAFLSLAILKRTTGLRALAAYGGAPPSHVYTTTDLRPLVGAGIASGAAAVVVTALFLRGSVAAKLYATPEWLWPVVPAGLYWLHRTWRLAARGRLDGDPVIFVLKDPLSYALALGVAALMVLAL
jgi:4-hydroxybenzoate polyprenyltransferase